MNNEFLIYLVGNIDSIIKVSAGIGALLLLSSIFSFAIIFDDNISNKWQVLSVLIALSGIIMIAIATLTPNSKTLAAMILVPKIIENERVIDIGDKTATVLEKKLDSWLEEITEKDNKKEGG